VWGREDKRKRKVPNTPDLQRLLEAVEQAGLWIQPARQAGRQAGRQADRQAGGQWQDEPGYFFVLCCAVIQKKMSQFPDFIY